MSEVTVNTYDELKIALKNKETNEIIIQNKELADKIKVVGKIKKSAPWLVGAVCAAIPLIPFTGGASLIPSAVGITTAVGGTGSAILIGICIAIGGTLLISLFTDWDEVEFSAGGATMKLKRKKK